MAKSVEKYLKKISKLLEESSVDVKEKLIKRIEDMINHNDNLSAVCSNPQLVVSAVFHELFGYQNHLPKSEFIPNIDLQTHLPLLAINDTFVVDNKSAQFELTVQKGDICIRTDINKHLFNKTGKNYSFRDWIDVSRVFYSEAAMLAMTEVSQGCDVFIVNLDKSFVNTTGKNEAMSDWSEIFDINQLSSAPNSHSQPNRENLGCCLSDVEHLILPPKTKLFTPETYYTVNCDHKSILYIHTIFGEAAYGYILSYSNDRPVNEFVYDTIILRNSDEICILYTKLSVVAPAIINFVKNLSKDFFVEVLPTHTNTLKRMVKETENSLDLPADSPDSTVRQLRQLLNLIKYLVYTKSIFHLERASIMIKVPTFNNDIVEELLSLKERGMIQLATKLQGSDICEIVIHNYNEN